MNNTLYLQRNKKTNKNIDFLIKRYGLSTCYEEKKEKALKSEELIVLIKKRYIFFRALSDNNKILSDMKLLLNGAE